MAKFEMEMPTELINQFEFLQQNAGEIIGGMTRAGAERAADNMRRRVSQAFKGNVAGKINAKLKVTKTYNTRKHETVTAARYYGYIPTGKKPFYLSQRGKTYGPYPGLPVPIILGLKEGGLKSTSMPMSFRKHWGAQRYKIKDPAFADAKGIEAAMLKAQKELSGGLLDD